MNLCQRCLAVWTDTVWFPPWFWIHYPTAFFLRLSCLWTSHLSYFFFPISTFLFLIYRQILNLVQYPLLPPETLLEMLNLLTEIVDELDRHPRELVLTHSDQLQLDVSCECFPITADLRSRHLILGKWSDLQ